MDTLLVSIITPTYNRKEYVLKAIKNAFSQSYGNIEMLIVDDCSDDGTFQAVFNASKTRPQIIPLRNETNSGQAGATNKAISLAKGKYIAILDDDDRWCDERKIEKQVAFLEKNREYVLVGGGVVKVDRKGKEIGRYLPLEEDKDIRKAILTDNVFAHSTVLFAKDAWEKAGGYQQNLKYFADWDLWLKLGNIGKFYNFQEFFCYYMDQEHGKNRNTHDYQIRRRLIANISLRRKYRNNYPGYAKSVLLCVANYLYSFLPFRAKLRPMLDKLRNLIFGKPPYTYINEHKT